MPKSATYRGYYIGLNRQGEVRRIYESADRGTVTLHGDRGAHPVMRGRQAQSEVVIVFGLTDVKYVSQFSFGSEHEKAIEADLRAKAEAKLKAKAGEEDAS